MNNKGFAITGFVYTILIIFVVLMVSILALLNSRKNVWDNLKKTVLGDVSVTSSITYDTYKTSGTILEFSAKANGYHEFQVYSPKIGSTNGSKITFEVYLSKGEMLYFLIGSSSYNSGSTEIRTNKNLSTSRIVRSSYILKNNYIAENFNNKVITNIETSENTVTSTTGKIVVNYLNRSRKNNDLNDVKYIKNCVNGNLNGTINRWTEIKAIVEGENKALGKIVTGTNINNYKNAVDNSNSTYMTSSSVEECVIVDLERNYNLDNIIIFHEEDNIYYGNKTYVSSDGINYTLVHTLEQTEDINGINISSFESKQVAKSGNIYVPVKEFESAIWLRVFHHNNIGGTVLWASKSQASLSGGYDQLHKQSILYSLNNYKNSSGKFEFLLEYSDKEGYNRWIQNSNPLSNTEYVSGYQAIKISWNQNNWKGLAKSSSGSTLIDGSIGNANWFYAIGATTSYQSGIPANTASTTQIVDLWVRVDNLN